MSGTKKIAFLGLMLSAVLTLTALEHMLPPLPLLPPNLKPGLSNVITMYCAFFVGGIPAAALNALKSFFVFLTRGPAAGLLSFCGGMLSVGVVIALNKTLKEKISYTALGIAGACAHNIGQYAAVSLLTGTPYMVFYLPVLIISGVIFGAVTGALLKIVSPILRNHIGVW